MPAAVTIAPGTFLAIVACSALAATVAAAASARGLPLPVVVVELLLGIAIGPQGLGLPLSQFISIFSALGLGLLFFFAGYEIDLQRIAGRPLRLGATGWGFSLVLA
jgi:Kef-type K+ transport system membrane component KefB